MEQKQNKNRNAAGFVKIGAFYYPETMTEDIAKEIFDLVKGHNDMKYCVAFTQRREQYDTIWTTRYGCPCTESVLAKEDYQQYDFYATIEEARERRDILPKIENKNYFDAFIFDRKGVCYE